MRNLQPTFWSDIRIPVRITPFVFAFFMSSIMAMLMCLVIVAASTGMAGDYAMRVLRAYKLAMPVAFVCVLIVRPIVVKLVAATVRQ
ncbi:MAG: DUF2798 domain-containing protein [Herminiimonas sp.]|uniref:DUF2798 domain-containing protein n=1 Tax=Herminiimonas sp. TaxID=1926289 RepID=UPI002721FB76|nr:DUF2798 domain-containing protein [Herminiimonas sp.]MDO9419839.1 DUF2798 domain-containing protein [Herminiimonas sp.]